MTEVEKVSNGVSWRDAPQVFGKCVEAEEHVRFLVVAAISDNLRNHQDVQHTIDSIGYAPQDGFQRPKL